MRVGVIANTEDPEAGLVEERLEELGATFVRRWRNEPERLTDLERNVDLLVLLGSDWSVYDPAFAVSIDAERSLVIRAIERGCPTLGICFGGQLIASALGCAVERAPHGEIGWVTVDSDQPELIGHGPWFQYHLDRWQPTAATPAIARNDRAPQALLHRRTLGLQFHPEVTSDVIDRWLHSGHRDIEVVGGTIDAIAADTERFIDDAKARCNLLVDSFLDRVAGAKLGAEPTL